ncbi:metallophosphoesterase [Salinadaptatus halalkaliphilus]|uniref:Metallophosphoesterase n=1 Tax=Salinadaptatus halalkaliphilus TaxID=2419781 RepID=A0A4S3TH29_9EURY|nr:metallophosphoesterase [Salinadaptatus halalkaliphilus]THE63201.1 metallophosphoesterase [Salinadaptatus halalkaliphilus]
MSEAPMQGLHAVDDRVLLGRLEQPTTEAATRLAVVGDPHVATRATRTPRVFHRTEQRLRTVIEELNQQAIDLVVCPGDLTKDGEPWNVERVDVLFEELEAPLLATPGNHDLQKCQHDHSCISTATFADRYATGSYPLRYEIGDLELFVVNTAGGPNGPYTDTHRGTISERQLAWLEEQLPTATTPIVVGHHNPFPIAGPPLRAVEPWQTFTMQNQDRVRAVLEANDVSLVLSGHHHLPSLASHGGVRQLIAPAIASYPQAYCLLEIDPTGTNVWLVSNATENARQEAYELAATGPPFVRTLLGLTETTLEACPVRYEPPRVAGEPLVDGP